MIRNLPFIAAASALFLTFAAASPAQAQLTLCNRTSYRMDVALGLEKHANVETRGWFQIDPGQCRQVIDSALDADMVYVHARTPEVYGSSPLPQNGNADFCVRAGDFTDRRTAAVVRLANRRGSRRRSRPTRRKARRSIWPKKPTMTTTRRGSPAFNGFW